MSSHAVVLVDGGDDGMDERGWVEKVVSEQDALKLLGPMCQEDLYTLEIVGSDYLRPDDPDAGDDQPWHVCEAGAARAVEFWTVHVVALD